MRDGKNGYRKLLEPVRPYQLWAGDWKELKIPTTKITVYVFLIIDVYTRQVKGHYLSLIKDTASAIHACERAMSISKDDPLCDTKELIMHTDQGSAYISDEYIHYWKNQGTILSWSNPGKPTQNPYSEAMISLLSRFCLSHYEVYSLAEVDEIIGDFLTNYNAHWYHQNHEDISPNERLEVYRKSSSKTAGSCPKKRA